MIELDINFGIIQTWQEAFYEDVWAVRRDRGPGANSSPAYLLFESAVVADMKAWRSLLCVGNNYRVLPCSYCHATKLTMATHFDSQPAFGIDVDLDSGLVLLSVQQLESGHVAALVGLMAITHTKIVVATTLGPRINHVETVVGVVKAEKEVLSSDDMQDRSAALKRCRDAVQHVDPPLQLKSADPKEPNGNKIFKWPRGISGGSNQQAVVATSFALLERHLMTTCNSQEDCSRWAKRRYVCVVPSPSPLSRAWRSHAVVLTLPPRLALQPCACARRGNQAHHFQADEFPRAEEETGVGLHE